MDELVLGVSWMANCRAENGEFQVTKFGAGGVKEYREIKFKLYISSNFPIIFRIKV